MFVIETIENNLFEYFKVKLTESVDFREEKRARLSYFIPFLNKRYIYLTLHTQPDQGQNEVSS